MALRKSSSRVLVNALIESDEMLNYYIQDAPETVRLSIEYMPSNLGCFQQWINNIREDIRQYTSLHCSKSEVDTHALERKCNEFESWISLGKYINNLPRLGDLPCHPIFLKSIINTDMKSAEEIMGR